MKRRILGALLAAATVMSTGCCLAREGSGSSPMNDQLVGMYVTVSVKGELGPDGTQYYESVWDSEEMGMEPLHTFQSQGEKLYARRVETPDTTDDGVSDPRYAWEFPGDYGLVHLTYYESAAEDSEGFWNSIRDPELSGGHTRIGNQDGLTQIDLESTLYIADTVELDDLTVYMNPVYQTPEGELYALGTGPMGIDASSLEGYTETVSQKVTVMLPDGVKSSGGSITLRGETVVLPGLYVILEMDQHNELLRHSEYTPEQMPDTYTPGADTAYLILEARSDGKTVRSVYSPDDESAVMDTFYPGRYGICVKGYTHIEWEGVE